MYIKLFLLILCLFSLNTIICSQTYITFTPSLTTIQGTILDKGNLSFEVGHQFDVFSVGAVYGKSSLASEKKDTTSYFEIRTNLNIFQQGKFTNTFTIGAGYIPLAKNNFLTEVTYTIEYSLSETFHINILAGNYLYSGLKTTSSEPFVGISLTYYFKPFVQK
jgi:hypothetical protein